jgi:hypothetical protein
MDMSGMRSSCGALRSGWPAPIDFLSFPPPATQISGAARQKKIGSETNGPALHRDRPAGHDGGGGAGGWWMARAGRRRKHDDVHTAQLVAAPLASAIEGKTRSINDASEWRTASGLEA